MKNHIKNYIKIMGLAAVPFGTAQAEDYTITVTQKYPCDSNNPKSEKDGAMHFEISVSEEGGKSHVAEIVWPNDKEYPEPILYPNGFMREYGNELRTKKEVHDALISFVCNKIPNALEWLYYRDKQNKLVSYEIRKRNFTSKDSSVMTYLKGNLQWRFGVDVKEAETVFELFEKGKRAIELLEEQSDERIQDMQEACGDQFEEIRSKFYHRRLNLPKGCTCVMYYLEIVKGIGSITCRFWLMRDPQGFKLALWVPCCEVGNLTVLSDVPTITWGGYNSLCSSNEILSTSAREFMWDNFFASTNVIKSKGRKLTARFFIRQGHRADEIELNGENATPDKCDYFVQTDPFGEKITDIWEKGKRLDTEDIKDRKFKDPKEIMKFLEGKFGKEKEEEKE